MTSTLRSHGYAMSPTGDAWTEFTHDMTPTERREFGEFVDRIDPNAGTDRDRLEALRMSWGASTGVYPAHAGWPTRPAKKPDAREERSSGPPLWFRLIIALLALGMLIGAWSRPPMIAFGMGTSQAIAGTWTPLGYALSGFGVLTLIVWVVFFWKD